MLFFKYVLMWSALLILMGLTSTCWEKCRNSSRAWFWAILGLLSLSGFAYCSYQIFSAIWIGSY